MNKPISAKQANRLVMRVFLGFEWRHDWKAMCPPGWPAPDPEAVKRFGGPALFPHNVPIGPWSKLPDGKSIGMSRNLVGRPNLTDFCGNMEHARRILPVGHRAIVLDEYSNGRWTCYLQGHFPGNEKFVKGWSDKHPLQSWARVEAFLRATVRYNICVREGVYIA